MGLLARGAPPLRVARLRSRNFGTCFITRALSTLLSDCAAIWDTYKGIIVAANGDTQFEEVERFAFYERSKKAFCVVATGETALYGNLILKKGIIGSDGK